jgi:hypothetical protein
MTSDIGGTTEFRTRLLKRFERFEFYGACIEPPGAFPLFVPVPRQVAAADFRRDYAGARQKNRAWLEFAAAHDGVKAVQKIVGTRLHSDQDVVTGLEFSSIDALARFLGAKAKKDLARFRQSLTEAVDAAPEVAKLLSANPGLAFEACGHWKRLVSIAAWLKRRPSPCCFLREIDLPGIDTKYIERRRALVRAVIDHLAPECVVVGSENAVADGGFERRYGFKVPENRVRFRTLDPRLAIEGRYTDITVPVSELAVANPGASIAIAVENEKCFLALPEIPGAIAIMGSGCAVTVLERVSWLAEIRLLYGGDMDRDGFKILASLRKKFPHAESILMDRFTLLASQEFCGEDDGSAIENLPLLTPEEEAAFNLLSTLDPPRKLRLEQERIPFTLVKQAIYEAVTDLHKAFAPGTAPADPIAASWPAYDPAWKISE